MRKTREASARIVTNPAKSNDCLAELEGKLNAGLWVRFNQVQDAVGGLLEIV